MKISEAERQAIKAVLEYGATFGYGNLIAHLQTGWARHLVASGIDEEGAKAHAGGVAEYAGYPFKMQDDLVERGEWDETGARYAEPKARGGR